MKKYGWIALLVFLLDRASKLLWPRIPSSGFPLIPGVLGLYPAQNTGMAFSLLSGRPWLLGLLSLGVIVGGFFFLRKKNLRPLCWVGLMMMLGGAVGNLVDRLITGFVPDMIELLFVRFAIFNLADVALVVGCLLVMIDLFRGEEHG
ncbi:MAG: signal peptidase II [Clostridia bacterium]|nr:signal peptidase II [Clostridia bacterium]